MCIESKNNIHDNNNKNIKIIFLDRFFQKMLRIILVLSIVLSVLGQGDVYRVIDELFETNMEQNVKSDGEPNQTFTRPSSGTSDCTCVPYYICKNNVTLDGFGIIDIR